MEADRLIGTLIFVGVIILIILIIRGLINSARNTPSWRGIIWSAIFGVLPFYLIMCFFGWAGESREEDEEDDDPFADRWQNDK